MLFLTSHTFFHTRFLPFFSPLALLGLLYTILVLFAYQGHHILHNLGPVFRVFVPMVLYFCVMWTAGFALVWRLSRRYSASGTWRYDMAVVQAFTAGSNNFVSEFERTCGRELTASFSGIGHCGDHSRIRRRL